MYNFFVVYDRDDTNAIRIDPCSKMMDTDEAERTKKKEREKKEKKRRSAH